MLQNAQNLPTQSPEHFSVENIHWTDRVPKPAMYAFNTLAISFLLLMAAQLAWPSAITTPLRRHGDQAFGFKTRAGLEASLTELNNRELTVMAGDESYSTSFANAGLTVDSAATSKQLLSYPWYERLQPFTLFRRDAPAPLLHFDDSKLNGFASELKEQNTQPANAVVKLVNGKYAVAKPSKDGVEYKPSAIVAQIKLADPAEPETVAAASKIVQPQVSTEDAVESIEIVTKKITQKTTITADGRKYVVPKAKLKKFVTINYDKKKGLLEAGYNTSAITKYVETIQRDVFIPAKPAVVTSLDGEVTSRTKAKSGQTISIDESVKTVVGALKQNQASMKFTVVKTSAATQFSRTYTATNKGLQILIQDWQADTGLNVGVVVRELSGKGRTAALNGSQVFLPASMSKLFLVDYLYYRVSSGSLKMSSKLGTGMTIAHCIERMIVVSDNVCFNSFGNAVGWTKVSSYAVNSGFTSTNPNPAIYTSTAYDITDYFQKLHNGSLVTSSQRSQLLGYLQGQIYRSGIPLGSGVAVADKVGYYGGYRHDAGIVYHPKSTYVLTVMTSGGTDAQISDLARRISTYMNK